MEIIKRRKTTWKGVKGYKNFQLFENKVGHETTIFSSIDHFSKKSIREKSSIVE